MNKNIYAWDPYNPENEILVSQSVVDRVTDVETDEIKEAVEHIRFAPLSSEGLLRYRKADLVLIKKTGTVECDFITREFLYELMYKKFGVNKMSAEPVETYAVTPALVTKKDTTQVVCDLLNDMLKVDPDATNLMFRHSVKINEALDNHAQLVPSLEPWGAAMGPLGVVNGIMNVLGATKIQAMWEVDAESGSLKLLGFGVK